MLVISWLEDYIHTKGIFQHVNGTYHSILHLSLRVTMEMSENTPFGNSSMLKNSNLVFFFLFWKFDFYEFYSKNLAVTEKSNLQKKIALASFRYFLNFWRFWLKCFWSFLWLILLNEKSYAKKTYGWKRRGTQIIFNFCI